MKCYTKELPKYCFSKKKKKKKKKKNCQELHRMSRFLSNTLTDTKSKRKF